MLEAVSPKGAADSHGRLAAAKKSRQAERRDSKVSGLIEVMPELKCVCI